MRRLHAWMCIRVATLTMLAAVGCSRGPSAPDGALRSFSAEALMQDIHTLASDEFEGRGPSSPGEELTVRFLENKFREYGLAAGNPDGTYVQRVPLVGITPDSSMKLTIDGRGQARLKFRDDFVAWTKRVTESAEINAEMIFVGYGVQAPEYAWDDFKGADVRGKVIVVLVNDPPLDDPKMFGGPAMTYYGRWTYKFEKAAELGAAGCFIIHSSRAGYGWDVVRNSWGGEQFDLAAPDRNMGRAAIEGWLNGGEAEAIFKMAGKDLAALVKAAGTADFRPVSLGLRAKLAVKNTLRNVASRNVIARLEGSDEKLKNEYVLYSAHWDHFGIGPEVNGQRIYHGAKDNASGTAALLEIARAFKKLSVAPRRSILFLAVTGEEQGLLGSRYYAENPLYPLTKTVAAINMDAVNVLGRTKDIVVVGHGKSTLEDDAEEVARAQGRKIKPDPEPEKGFYYRSDHFEFAKKGVPALYLDEGIEYVGKAEGWGLQMRDQYTREDYHKPSDTVKDYWDLAGLVEDSQLNFMVGYRVANGARIPEWKPGAEFKAIREASLGQNPASR